MSSLTKEAYKTILIDFKECAQGTTIILILADYEASLKQVCAEVFPDSRIAGCSTHYDRVSVTSILYHLLIFCFILFIVNFYFLGSSSLHATKWTVGEFY